MVFSNLTYALLSLKTQGNGKHYPRITNSATFLVNQLALLVEKVAFCHLFFVSSSLFMSYFLLGSSSDDIENRDHYWESIANYPYSDFVDYDVEVSESNDKS